MWVDTPLEGFLVISLFISFVFAIGIESEQRVRESWLMSITHKGYVSEAELKNSLKEHIEDCRKKKTRFFYLAFALCIVNAFVGSW
ncbi:hypothetical protein N9D67_02670 [Gammaproteobacteria bacterium]|jgi:hypothetical protein|nr:hypothetical protein [Gammaproteobacteria bacterium]